MENTTKNTDSSKEDPLQIGQTELTEAKSLTHM